MTAIQKKIVGGLILLAGFSVLGGTGYYFFLRDEPVQVEEEIKIEGIDQSFLAATPEPAPKPKPKPAPKPVPPPAPPKDIFEKVEVEKPDPRIAEINRLRALSGATMVVSKGGEDGKRGFVQSGAYPNEPDTASDSTYLKRVITADKMIEALLINEVISDQPGQITAQISHDIYGTHGRDVLIPKGSKAIGNYLPLQRIGDERLVAFWERIITPEGVNIQLSKAQLADTMGRTGGYGELDRRYMERYGLSLMISTLTALGAAAMPSDTSDQKQVVVNTYAQDLSGLSKEILKEHIKTAPRLTMAAGSRIIINPVKDIYFPETSSGSVLVTSRDDYIEGNKK